MFKRPSFQTFRRTPRNALSPFFDLMYTLGTLVTLSMAANLELWILRLETALFAIYFLFVAGLSFYCLIFDRDAIYSENYLIHRLRLTREHERQHRDSESHAA